MNLVAVTLALLPQTAAIEFAADAVDVPMTHVNRCVAVTVEIGGEPYNFQVDTYASIDACIDDDLAAALGLSVLQSVKNTDGRTSRSRDIVNVPELRLGGATWTDMRALVDDYDWINGDGARVHGLLGFPAFRDVLLTFDYPGDRLVLTRGTLSEDEPFCMPFEGGGRAPDVWLQLGDQRLRFGVDTGSSGALSLPLSDSETLSLYGELAWIGRARTVYSEYDIRGAALAHSLELAGHRIDAPHADFSEGSAGRLLGYQVLRPFAVTFDQRAERVRFVRPPLPAAAELSDEALERWVGVYVGRGAKFTVEREGRELFVRKGDQPREATTALSADELLLRSKPVRLQLAKNARNRPVIRIVEHPDRPVAEAVRVASR